jgi:serine/threonine protein kinase
MAKKLKVGDTIHGYRIVKVFGPGMMAISYAAQGRSGEKVFFKQYKSPAPTVVWYPGYVAYQKELSARVRSGRAGHFAVRQLDAFEAVWGGPCYFQAYEFVERGGDLQQMLDVERERHRLTKVAPAREPTVWARHVTWAKVLTAAIAALHESNIVHADLKPANAYLIEDSSLGSGYQLKLIDMDFSLLSDRKAPWHGFQGYIGSDNYRSPEHLTRGAVPGPASDVFTCGLILYELLAGEHPYWRDEQAEYASLVKAYSARPPALLGSLPPPALNAEVSALLHRCLSPDPAARPTAAALRDGLSGRGARAEPPKRPRARVDAMATAPATRTTGEPLVGDGIELVSATGRTLQIGVRTELGKAVVRHLGVDGEFWDHRQCVFDRDARRQWTVAPVAGSVNDTLVNGKTLTNPRPLVQGDVIAVGRQEKGVLKLPLTARRR